jgi:hypothetical protein
VFLPDSRHFVYFRYSDEPTTRGLYIGDIGTKPEQQDSRRLLETDYSADYAPSISDPGVGHLLYIREGTLLAQPFDTRWMVLTGAAAPVAESVGGYPNGWFAVSSTGTLAYRTAPAVSKHLSWIATNGTRSPIPATQEELSDVVLSPEGTHAAVTLVDQTNRDNTDIWIIDLVKGLKTRLTFDKAVDRNPVWSPDGKRIVFSSNRAGKFDLYWKNVNGATAEELLLKSDEAKFALDWSHDGEYLLYQVRDPRTKLDLWYLPMNGDKRIP